MERSTVEDADTTDGSMLMGAGVGVFTSFLTLWLPLLAELDSDAAYVFLQRLTIGIILMGLVFAVLSRESRRTWVGFSTGIFLSGGLMYLFLMDFAADVGS